MVYPVSHCKNAAAEDNEKDPAVSAVDFFTTGGGDGTKSLNIDDESWETGEIEIAGGL